MTTTLPTSPAARRKPRPIPRHRRSTRVRRQRRRRTAEQLAASRDGVVSRRELYAAGFTRAEIRANVAARRWQRVGRHVLAIHTGPLTQTAILWAAQLSGGPRAQLDGVSALLAAGLTGFDVEVHRVSVPRGARTFRDAMVDVRQTRRWSADDCVGAGVPRTRPEVAAVRAALWARTDKQAALLLTMTVQQGLAPPERIGRELLRIKRAPRLPLVCDVVADLLGGVRSLGELDFAGQCRARGLPEPTRQVVRRHANGRHYLDAVWEEYGVVVEVDGVHHSFAREVVRDALRQNRVTMAGETVLRLPVLGLRIAADEFFDQVEQALLAAGWEGLGPAA